MIELMRDEILERLDELYYGPQYPEQIYIIERRSPNGQDQGVHFESQWKDRID